MIFMSPHCFNGDRNLYRGRRVEYCMEVIYTCRHDKLIISGSQGNNTCNNTCNNTYCVCGRRFE
jgi:hypothetical protein